MALYEIEFHRIEHYYHSEYIEADSKEHATEIANSLLESRSYENTIIDHASYEWGENEFQGAYLAEDYKLPSMTGIEISEYLED